MRPTIWHHTHVFDEGNPLAERNTLLAVHEELVHISVEVNRMPVAAAG
jgi:hypothetical protein